MKQIATWVGITVIIIVAVIGLIKLSNAASTQPPPQTTAANMPKITSADNYQGSSTPKATVVEYADFQCPACKAEYPIVKQLTSDYKTKQVMFVYRYFPLEQVHKNALASAKAAYAAGKQGKFWEMHDKLFETQDSWADTDNAADTFAGFAKDLQLNMDQYNKDVNSSEAGKVITDSENGGINAGVNATPTFFINGQKLNSDVPPSYDQLKQLIDEQLSKK